MGTELAVIPEQVKAITDKFDLAMSPEERRFFIEHIAEGAPGFKQYLESDRLKRTIRGVIEDYKEFLRTGQ